MRQHGIFEDRSEWRAHVGWATGRVFFFKTADVRGMDLSRYPVRRASCAGGRYGTTACGYLVPVGDIPNVCSVLLPQDWLEDLFKNRQRYETASESQLGRWAETAVIDIVRRKLAPLTGDVERVKDVELQRAGIDLTVGGISVQCKSDFPAGRKEDGGSGNVYIQTHELNPTHSK